MCEVGTVKINNGRNELKNSLKQNLKGRHVKTSNLIYNLPFTFINCNVQSGLPSFVSSIKICTRRGDDLHDTRLIAKGGMMDCLVSILILNKLLIIWLYWRGDLF